MRVRKYAAPARAAATTGKYLTFQLGRERFGLPIAPIEQVLREPEVLRVPQRDGEDGEVFSFRGEVVGIVDLRWAVGAERSTDVTHLVVVWHEPSGGHLALRVGRVGMVYDVPQANVETLPAGSRGALVSAVAYLRDGLLPVLNLAALADPPPVVKEKASAPRPETITADFPDGEPRRAIWSE